jgi:hypothetical protein
MQLKNLFLTMNRKYLLLILFSPIIISYFFVYFLNNNDQKIAILLILSAQIIIILIWEKIIGSFLFENVEYIKKEKFNLFFNQFFIITLIYILMFYLLYFIRPKIEINSWNAILISLFLTSDLYNLYLELKIQYLFSKLFSALKYKKDPSKDEIFEVFMLFVTLPVGIWIFQPKITEFYNEIILKEK